MYGYILTLISIGLFGGLYMITRDVLTKKLFGYLATGGLAIMFCLVSALEKGQPMLLLIAVAWALEIFIILMLLTKLTVRRIK